MISNVSFSIVALMLFGCGDKSDVNVQDVSPVKVKEMIVGMTAQSGSYKYSGTVEEDNGTPVSFIMGGTITQLKVKIGDAVRKGQLLASVDPTSVKNSYEIANASKLQAEDAYRRMKQLHDNGSLPEIKWVEVQSKLQQAVSAESIAKKNLEDCNLYAPVSGVVSDKYLEVGQNAAPGMPVIKIVSTRVLNVKVPIPESEVAGITIGQHADIIVPALGDSQYSGTVTEKGVVADPISRSYTVKIKIGDEDTKLLPGMVTKVAMERAKAGDEIVIPSVLIQLGDDNSNFVWVDEDGKAARRFVECGEYRANGVTIVKGLNAGDKIITAGQQKVCTGTRITTK